MRLVITKEIVLKTKKKVAILVYVVIIVNNLDILLMNVKTKDKKGNLEITTKVKQDVIIVKNLDIMQETVMSQKEIIMEKIEEVLNVMNVVRKVIMP